MSKDYQDGFKDGFAKGLEEGKKLSQPQIGWPSTSPSFSADRCPKCGINISGVMGYVCHSPGCPTFPQVTCGYPMTAMTTGQFSVAGSDYTPFWNNAAGANGPSGPVHLDVLGKTEEDIKSSR